MPVIQKLNPALAAGGVLENVLSGSAFEFASRNSVVSIGSVASLADVFLTIQIGANIVLEESEMAVRTVYPVIPDEMYYQDIASQGDRIVVRIRNANAGAVDVRTLVQITPLS